MRKEILIGWVFILFFMSSCKTYETINGKQYAVRKERVNNGNLFTLILNMKVLYHPANNKQFLSYVESAKRLGYEKKTDPYYISSKIEVDNKNEILIVKNYHINGYDTISKKDSIYKYFKIIKRDSLELNKVINYYQGVVVKEERFNDE